jgi:hypothetical protein
VFAFITYGLIKMAIDFSHQPNVSASAALALIAALLILLIGMLGDVISTRLGRFAPNAVIGVRTQEDEIVAAETGRPGDPA